VYGAGTPPTVGAFEAAELVTSVCGAFGRGRTFSSGTLEERATALDAFRRDNHGADVAFVVTEAELNAEIARQLAGSQAGAPVPAARVTVGPAGVHFAGDAQTPLGTFTVTGDASMGPVAGRLALRIRDLSAGPIPSAILDQVKVSIEENAGRVGGEVPFLVRQVVLRPGCFAILGTTR
jgi:hypothetical protein